MTAASSMTMTPADILKFQNDLIRTGKAAPLGIMKNVSIGPHKDVPPLPTWDPIMKKFGRLIQFRGMRVPIAKYPVDGMPAMILVPGLLQDREGRVRLPDLPDPEWHPADFTPDEAQGLVTRDPAKDQPRTIEQSLRDRAEAFLEGTNFYVFSPVLSIAFQPEQNGALLGTFWAIDCQYNSVDRTHPTLLVDAKTGETHFFGGLYSIVRAAGEI